MRKYFFRLVPICFYAFFSSSIYASSKTTDELIQRLDRITLEAESLQKEMRLLKAELRALKVDKDAQQKELDQLKKQKSQVQVVQAPPVQQQTASNHSTPNSQTNVYGQGTPYQVGSRPRHMTRHFATPDNYRPTGGEDPSLIFPRFPTVTTSPYIGLRTAFDASDVLINVPTMGEDIRLLRARKKTIEKLGFIPFKDRPIIVISGKLETIAFIQRTYQGFHNSDVDLASSELDFLVEASEWAFGFISFSFDNTSLDNSFQNTAAGSRVANSNIFLKRGFITLGNLRKTGFYFSAGQMFVDFGRYASSMASPPLTALLGQTNERQIQLGYAAKNGLGVSAYLFRGPTFVNNPNKVDEGGVNLRFAKDFGKERTVNAGVGMISNLADSLGMQITGLAIPRRGFSFLSNVFAGASPSELLVRRVPAVNAHAEIELGAWTMMGEYIGGIRSFDAANITYNGKGALTKAMHLELNRKFELFGKPANAGISYGHSSEALAIGLPRHKYSGVFNISPFKNTVLSLELSRSQNYPCGSTAYLKGALIPVPTPFVSPGGYSDFILVQLGLYF